MTVNPPTRSTEDLFNLICDTYSFRRFPGINFLEEQVPDAMTLLNFRHLPEEHNICRAILDDVHRRLEEAGLMMQGGSIVDATIITAPSSIKNAKG